MPLYEKKWWQKLFAKKERHKKVNVVEDIEAINEFIADINSDVEVLKKELKKLQELEKEYSVAKSGIIQVNLETQAGVLDKILERYEFFQNDVDINGLRVKNIAKEFLRKASKNGMKDLVETKKQDKKWKFLW